MSGPGYCFNCGDSLDEGGSLCDDCGPAFAASLDDGNCPECGSDNIEEFPDGAVCADCGFEGE
jgi:predicted amidophosphoribosyltransferase